MISKNAFVNGFLIVGRNGKKNYINENEEILSDVWFERAGDFTEYGLAFVEYNGNTNVINDEGKLLLEKHYSSIRIFGNVIIAKEIIKKARRIKENIEVIDRNGKRVITHSVLRLTSYANEGYIVFTDKNLSQNVVGKNGKLLSDTWYAMIRPIKFDKESDEIYFCVAKYNSKNKKVYNVLDKEGNAVFSRKWFEDIDFDIEELVKGEAVSVSRKAIVKYNGVRYIWHLTGKNKLEEIK